MRAAHLLVPFDLEMDARVALKSAERVVASSSGGTLNPLLGENIAIHADNRLGAAGVTNPADGAVLTGSATNWFLMCSPSAAPMIEVGYVRGTGRAPVVRGFQLSQGQFGLGWDVKMDIGAKALAYHGMYQGNA